MRAFIFPGQGSQSVGMLADFLDAEPLVRETFAEASEALSRDLAALCRTGPAADLDATVWTQPALLTASVALHRLWCAQGGSPPVLMAGHSLGEYSALVCAGAVGFAEAVRLVHERGRCMQQAVPAGTGAMAAVLGLDDEVLAQVCRDAAMGEVVAPANYNAPGQTVIAGHAGAVTRAGEAARAAGAKRVIPLAVSVPSHCSLMSAAASDFAVQLARAAFVAPRITVLHDVDAAPRDTPADIRIALQQQLEHPVQWVAITRALAARGATQVFECGPGRVLTALVNRTVPTLGCTSLGRREDFHAALAQAEAEA